jgi:hypothetical protein
MLQRFFLASHLLKQEILKISKVFAGAAHIQGNHGSECETCTLS